MEIPWFYTSKELCCRTVGEGWGDEESCESCLDIDMVCGKGYMYEEGTTNCVGKCPVEEATCMRKSLQVGLQIFSVLNMVHPSFFQMYGDFGTKVES